jgi:peptide/nickel transport system substrate-binding protein
VNTILLLVALLYPGAVLAEVVLRAGTTTELEPLSPLATSGFWYGVGYTGLVHMPLITYSPPQARYGPCLARAWEMGADNRSILFYLYPEARWHDGEPVQAEDVAFSMEYYKEHQIIGQLWRFLDRVEARDPHTVEVFFTEPVAFYQSMFFPWPKIVPRHVWEKVKEPGVFQGEAAMVGCGLFAFAGYDADARVARLRRAPDFFGGRTAVGMVEIRFFGSIEALVLALKRGDIDLVMGPNSHLPPVYGAALEGAEGVELMEVENGGVPLTLIFSGRREPTRRQGFREAVAHAVDCRALIAAVAQGQGQVPGRGFVPPGAWTYGGPFPMLRHDPGRAGALLDSLGFVDINGDGWREDERGEALRLELVAETWQAQGETERAAELIAYQLRQVGLQVEVVKYLVEEEYTRLWEERDYQMYVGYATHASTRDGGHVYFAQYRDFSYGTFADSAYLALLDRITSAPDEAAYAEAARAAQQYNAQELPGLALVWGPRLFAFRKDRFQGWQAMASYGIPNYASWFGLKPVEPRAGKEGGASWAVALAGGVLLLALLWAARRKYRS